MRKRISRGLEPMPARTRWKRALDRVVLAAGLISPAVALPQVIQIYTTGDATGLVAFSWGAWAAMNIPWVFYGLAHKEMPIVISYTCWFGINSLVCIGAILYGGAIF